MIEFSTGFRKREWSTNEHLQLCEKKIEKGGCQLWWQQVLEGGEGWSILQQSENVYKIQPFKLRVTFCYQLSLVTFNGAI